MADADNSPNFRTPPYVAYKTFLTLIDDLHTHSLPPVIDRSVLKRFSGGVGSQLLMAIKSLGLCGDNNKPNESLAEMVRTYKTPAFKNILKDALVFGYPFLASIDLMTATPGMFADAFKATGAKEDVLRKCRRFYLAAAQDAGIPIGPRILGGMPKQSRNNGASSASAGQPRKRGNKIAKRPEGTGSTNDDTANRDRNQNQTVQTQLLSKFPTFDPTWPDNIKQAWFAGFKDLMNATGNKTGDE